MDLILPTDDIYTSGSPDDLKHPPEPDALSTSPSMVDGRVFAKLLTGVRDDLLRARGAAFGNAWLGGFDFLSYDGTTLVTGPGVAQLMNPTIANSLTGVDGCVRTEKPQTSHTLDQP